MGANAADRLVETKPMGSINISRIQLLGSDAPWRGKHCKA